MEQCQSIAHGAGRPTEPEVVFTETTDGAIEQYSQDYFLEEEVAKAPKTEEWMDIYCASFGMSADELKKATNQQLWERAWDVSWKQFNEQGRGHDTSAVHEQAELACKTWLIEKAQRRLQTSSSQEPTADSSHGTPDREKSLVIPTNVCSRMLPVKMADEETCAGSSAASSSAGPDVLSEATEDERVAALNVSSPTSFDGSGDNDLVSVCQTARPEEDIEPSLDWALTDNNPGRRPLAEPEPLHVVREQTLIPSLSSDDGTTVLSARPYDDEADEEISALKLRSVRMSEKRKQGGCFDPTIRDFWLMVFGQELKESDCGIVQGESSGQPGSMRCL
jgi:hypothetical protein